MKNTTHSTDTLDVSHDPKTGAPLGLNAPGCNRAAFARAHAAKRAAIVAALGLPAEDLTSPGERYASSTGELFQALRDRHLPAIMRGWTDVDASEDPPADAAPESANPEEVF